FLLRDPHIAMRGDEAAHLLLTLKREGYHTAFLGREAVHPEILDRLVHQLQNKSDVLPWGFEGRFGSYLSTDFIQSLKNSGCCGTVFGLETPSDRLNTLMDKYDGNVNISFIERIIDDYRQVNMLVNVNTIANLPGTTPEEYVSHIQWLKNQFNKNPLFHFTANYFGLYEHSEIGKHPDKYGLELTSLAKSCGLHHELGLEQIMGYGWKPLSGKREPNLSLNAWQEIFHVDSRWGVNLGTLHILYHECYNISAVDMLLQTNCFKRLQAELEFLSHKSPLHFRIPEHVLVKPVTRKGKEGSLFFDRNTGTMEFVSNKVLQTIQSGENDSPPVRIKKPHSPAAEILEELFLEKFKQDQASHLKSILQLAASDLLSWD
ncbi:MAG: radical SAM protein, partial [uncultured bacterium]